MLSASVRRASSYCLLLGVRNKDLPPYRRQRPLKRPHLGVCVRQRASFLWEQQLWMIEKRLLFGDKEVPLYEKGPKSPPLAERVATVFCLE